MRLRSVLVLSFGLTVLTTAAAAQEQATNPAVLVSHLKGPLHRLEVNEVNMVASVGEDGILLVDTGYPATASQVQQALAELGDGPVRVIVNTHGDFDHTGGNAALGKDGVVISSPAERERMDGYFGLSARDPAEVSTMTVADEATIYFNGDTIRLLSVPGGHRSGDLAVHFTGQRVFCAGDLVLSTTFPDADRGRGGDAQRLHEILKELSHTLPAETLLVPGHGPNLTMTEFATYVAMVHDSIAAVQQKTAEGRPLSKILESRPLATWARWEGPGDISMDGWTASIYSSLTGETLASSISAPISEALINDGADAATRLYWLLRKEQPRAWNFAETELNRLGYELLQRGMVADAIAIFKLNVEAFPEAFNPYDSLGEAYLAAGQTELAISNYQRSLELNPDNTNAAEVLDRLRAE